MVPEKTRVLCTPHTCKRVLIDKNGIGEGREYVSIKPNNLLDPLEEPEIDFYDF